MDRLLFDEQTKEWKELSKDDPKHDNEIRLDPIRRRYLDKIRKDLGNDLDHVEIICGSVGSGKSTLGRVDCRYVSNDNFHPRTHVIRDEQDIRRVIKSVKRGEAILIDEGSMIFAAVETMTKKQKYANLILDMVRQKNLLIVICAPHLHRLSSSLVIDRATTVSRTYIFSKTGQRGRFAFYGTNAKEKLYRFAKKNHGSLRGAKPKYRGRFSKDLTHEEEYRKVKDETLNKALDSLGFGDEEDISKPPTKKEIVKDYQIDLVKNNMELSQNDMVKLLGVSLRTVARLREEAKGVLAHEI